MLRSNWCSTRSILKSAIALLFVFAQVAVRPVPGGAAPNDQAKIALHLLPVTTKNACARSTATPPCAEINTRGALFPTLYYGYLLVTNADATAGLSGVQCGLGYKPAFRDGVDVFTWNLCASLEFPSSGWPASGGGNLITWNSDNRCQRNEPGGAGTGVVAAAGFFYLAAYTPDVMQVTTRPADGQARVADCSNVESIIAGGGVNTVPSPLGAAAFSTGAGTPGYNPCDAGATTIDCGIEGPDPVVAGSTGNIYSAPNAPAGATYNWSVSGNGTLVGAGTNATASVQAGAAGSYTVIVLVTWAGMSANCSRTVSVVNPPPTCTITGPSSVNSRTAQLSFDVQRSDLSTTIDWSITGNGNITGLSHSTRVSVTSGEAGAFELTATLHSPDSPLLGVCSKTVTVVEPVPQCTIMGPDVVLSGQGGLGYSVAPATGELTAVSWSITGDGTLTSAADQPVVTVQAGATGAFDLTAVIHTNGSLLPGSCTHTTTVNASVPVTCSIAGPLTVPSNATGFGYSVSASGPITSVDWSISGNGTIPAGVHASSITVSSGAAGGFDLTAVVHTSNSYETGTCLLPVTVSDAAPTCAITGPTSALTGATNLSYDVSVAGGTVTGVSWTISGNGTITSNPNMAPVYVTATAAGAFELTATAQSTASPLPAICRQVVTVSDAEPPSCLIDGPTSVSEGATDIVYTLLPLLPYDTVEWSLTGDGTITSSVMAPVIHVQSGNPGAFTLTATLHGPGAETHTCAMTVSVTYLACLIQGPATVFESTTPVTFTSGPPLVGASYQWHAASGAQIVGPSTNADVSVRFLYQGTFLLSLTITRNGFPLSCSRSILVPAPSGNGNNGNAKLMVHLAAATTKNACALGAPACAGVKTNGRLLPDAYFAYLLVGDGSAGGGVGGLQCGITYDAADNSGVDIYDWTLCATLDFRSPGPNGLWPAAGGGNLITWETATRCQRSEPGGFGSGVVATAGYFYCGAYSPDVLRVIPRPVDNQAKVADCGSVESLIGGVGYPGGGPSHLGFAQFSDGGAVPGYNPCGVALPVRVTTWSAIKGMYH